MAPIENARDTRDANTIYPDAAGIAQEEYVRSKPTAVKPARDKAQGNDEKMPDHLQFPHVVGSLVVASNN